MHFLEVPILVATGRNVPMNPPQTPDYTNLCQVVDMTSADPCSNFPSNMPLLETTRNVPILLQCFLLALKNDKVYFNDV